MISLPAQLAATAVACIIAAAGGVKLGLTLSRVNGTRPRWHPPKPCKRHKPERLRPSPNWR